MAASSLAPNAENGENLRREEKGIVVMRDTSKQRKENVGMGEVDIWGEWRRREKRRDRDKRQR